MSGRREELHLVAVRENDVVYGGLADLADYLFVSVSKVRNRLLDGRKIRGYKILEEWRWKHKLLNRKTGEIIAEATTIGDLCKKAKVTRYQIGQIRRYGDPYYQYVCEKEILWHE